MTVKEKQNVTLPCKAAGFPPPVITWYKDGDVIEEERRQFKKRNLEINEIQFEDRGVYVCIAENLLGRIRTSVNVTVKGNCINYNFEKASLYKTAFINKLTAFYLPSEKK